jgi:hypothetical protein
MGNHRVSYRPNDSCGRITSLITASECCKSTYVMDSPMVVRESPAIIVFDNCYVGPRTTSTYFMNSAGRCEAAPSGTIPDNAIAPLAQLAEQLTLNQ